MKIKIILMVIASITLTAPMMGMKNTINFKNMKNLNIKNTISHPKASILSQNNLFRNYSTKIKFGRYGKNIKISNASGQGWKTFASQSRIGNRFDRSYGTSNDEKVMSRMQKDQAENYRETIATANKTGNEDFKKIRKKIKAILNDNYGSPRHESPEAKKKGIYIYMKNVASGNNIFSLVINDEKNAKNDPQKNKIRILAARIYLLEKQLKKRRDDIDLSDIENNAFYQYTKINFLSDKTKQKLFQDLDSLVMPVAIDDFINTLRDMTWNPTYSAYSMPDQNNVAQDLFANALLKYALFEPKCTTEQLIEFYYFLNKMKTNRKYREQQSQKLQLPNVDKNAKTALDTKDQSRAAHGLWPSVLSWLGKLFQSTFQAGNHNE